MGVEWREGGRPPRQLLLMTRRWRCYFLKKKGLEIRRKELHHDQEVILLLCGTKNANSGAQIKDHVYTPNFPPHTPFSVLTSTLYIFVCSCPDLGV